MSTGQITVTATPAEVAAALADLSAMVEWSGAAAVTVIERDDAGRPTRARWRESYGPLRDEFVLQYKWAPDGVSWWLLEGRILKRENGRYQLDALGGGRTRVTYSLEIGIGMPVPACIRRRVESILIEATLKALKNQALKTRP
ncbi:MAG: SRPBCC family protein [Mycobacterium sp.]|nr:SRPBCC family protein [Mycobacterium sp.]